jgi:hypothetical protein
MPKSTKTINLLRFLLVTLLLVIGNINKTQSQELRLLPEHEFYEILAGVHAQMDSFIMPIAKFDNKGNLLVGYTEIQIKNRVIVPEEVYFTQQFNADGTPESVSSIIEYLRAKDSILGLSTQPILQNTNVVIDNCVFYSLKIEEFKFNDFKLLNCDFRDGFEISSTDFNSFTCEVSFNYQSKNNLLRNVIWVSLLCRQFQLVMLNW